MTNAQDGVAGRVISYDPSGAQVVNPKLAVRGSSFDVQKSVKDYLGWAVNLVLDHLDPSLGMHEMLALGDHGAASRCRHG